MPRRRFWLDEDAAREWLGRAAFWEEAGRPADGPADLPPGIGPGWWPGADGAGRTMARVVSMAGDLQVMLGPPGSKVHLNFEPGGWETPDMYRLLVEITRPDIPAPLWLAGPCREVEDAGGGAEGPRGAGAVQEVLREARDIANAQLDALDPHRPPARPAAARRRGREAAPVRRTGH